MLLNGLDTVSNLIKKVPLDELFVNYNFPEHLIADVKAFGEKGEKKYIPIPPGEAKPCSSFPDHLQKGPPMKYKQKEDQNTCLVFSFVSVLHHIGARDAAHSIFRKNRKIIDRCDTVKRFSTAVRECDKHLYFTKLKVSEYNIG